jgi:hypothetical protein
MEREENQRTENQREEEEGSLCSEKPLGINDFSYHITKTFYSRGTRWGEQCGAL